MLRTNPSSETIAAISTASGAGGIGVVRVSGELSVAIANHILGHCPAPRYAAYLPFKLENEEVIDRGIAIFYPNPYSYTGEDVLELQAHGGMALMQLLLARCIALGARQAEPGEFTRRAYLNDKMDLAQAEAVADVINAATSEAAKSAARSLTGEFSHHINTLLLKLVNLRMYVEACLDFPEEEIDFITQGNVAEKLSSIQDELNLVFTKAKQGSLLREGINVVLVGQPNVGKSSLMNALAGEDIAIVTPIAGTTRDVIKSLIQINGVPLHIIDTAGLRETDDEVEKFGIARTFRALETAHIALLLIDAAHGIAGAEKSILERLPQEITKIWIHNKIDVSRETPKVEEIEQDVHVYLSAKMGDGLDLLKLQLLKIAGYQSVGEGVFMARKRHLDALTQVVFHLRIAMSVVGSAELLAEELRLAQVALGGITGKFTPDDLLGEIFSNFCIGK
ncbi:MAG: tRNA uridine-5-carboxymethylaminomethyl(34) synthesis GTPase MnmE [Methylophilaceae bacterium]